MDEFWNLISTFDDPQRDAPGAGSVPAPRARPRGGRALRGRAARRSGGAVPSARRRRTTPSRRPRSRRPPSWCAALGSGSVSRDSLRGAVGRARGHAPGRARGRARRLLRRGRAGAGRARARACCCCAHPAAEFPRTSLRLAQIVAGQTVTVLAGQRAAARAPRWRPWPRRSTRATTTRSPTPRTWSSLAGAVAARLGLPEPRSPRCATARCSTTWARWRSRTRSSTSAGPLDDSRVEGHARAPRDRRAHPPAHARAGRHRPARAPRARALGRRAATPTAWPARRSRSAAASSSPATPTTR